MSDFTITPVTTQAEYEELDALLWEVLWRPLGLPRNIRESFKIDGESVELVAKASGSLIGGLVANWTSQTEVELRHLAVKTDVQGRGVGSELVKTLVRTVARRSCIRIHTIARDSSTGFFRKLGFSTAQGDAPEHPVFERHGITFELMEMRV